MKFSLNNTILQTSLLLLVLCVTLGSLHWGPAVHAQGRTREIDLTPKAEEAIERGLEFLSRTQLDNGSWGEPAQTSLALMAFMLKGYFPDVERPDRYGVQLDRAVQFLLTTSKQNGGYFGGNMYHHALATLALAEAWGMSPRQDIRDALKSAVEVTLRAQNPAGGWRYQPMPVDADTSVTAMVVVSLAAAHEAGILVPDDVITKAVDYIKHHQHDSGGFSYTKRGTKPGFARTAACVLALQLTGHRDSEAVADGLKYIWETPADKAFDGTQHFAYAQYYAVQAMYQAGEEQYLRWYPRIHDLLLRQQRADGAWNGNHGPAYNTAMSILVLGVPYRYLPIYQR